MLKKTNARPSELAKRLYHTDHVVSGQRGSSDSTPTPSSSCRVHPKSKRLGFAAGSELQKGHCHKTIPVGAKGPKSAAL